MLMLLQPSLKITDLASCWFCHQQVRTMNCSNNQTIIQNIKVILQWHCNVNIVQVGDNTNLWQAQQHQLVPGHMTSCHVFGHVSLGIIIEGRPFFKMN